MSGSTRVGLLPAVLLLLLAGCGGGDDESGEATTATGPVATTLPAQSEWAQKADAICVSYQAQIDSLPIPETREAIVTTLNNTITLGRNELRALEALTPPPGQRVLVEQFLVQLRRALAAAASLARAAATDDTQAQTEALSEGELAGLAGHRLAGQLGLTSCGAG